MATEQSVNIILVEDDDGHAVLVEKNLRRAGLINGFQRLRDPCPSVEGESDRADFMGHGQHGAGREAGAARPPICVAGRRPSRRLQRQAREVSVAI